MKYFRRLVAACCSACWIMTFLWPPALAALEQEELLYSVNWPTGLSLGQAKWQMLQDGGESGQQLWHFVFSLEAFYPGMPINVELEGRATSEFCVLEFSKKYRYGKKQANEHMSFDLQTGIATRETVGGGGVSEVKFTGCPRDVLSFFAFLRSELAAGRLPPPQTVYFGAAYSVKVSYAGEERVLVQGEWTHADKLEIEVRGPRSHYLLEAVFDRSQSRKLLRATIPLEPGQFRLELLE